MRRFGTLALVKSWLRPSAPHAIRRRSRSRVRLFAEMLEARELLATAGTDYLLSGYRWANPGHITYSIAPDGVMWDHGTNNLNATLNAKFGNGPWQAAIARALATWESVANINITQVYDSPLDFGTYGLPQGDPRFGDIRFGGYSFPNNTTTLAQSYFPPPQGTTEAGDVDVNTAMPWKMGSDYDFFSVMLHETGLTLGLNEPPNPSVVMNTTYHGVLSGLTAGDIAGIQAIYGPRTLDAYQSQGQGVSPAGAIDVTAALNTSSQATIGNASLTTIGSTEYFSVVAPNASGLSLQVTAAASGVSMLSPKVTLLDPSGNVLDTESNPGAWSDNVTVHTGAIVPGGRYLIAVTGATSDVFAVGAYQLQVIFSGGPVAPTPTPTPPPVPVPPVVPPVTPPLNPTPQSPPVTPDRFESNNTFAQATRLGAIAGARTIGGLTLTTYDVDDFVFTGARAGIYQVSAAGTAVRIYDATGRLVAWGAGQVAVQVYRPKTKLFIQVSAPGVSPIAGYSLQVLARKTPIVPAHKTPRPRLRARSAPQLAALRGGARH